MSQADATNLPDADGSFDAVLMVTVFGEIPDGDAALRQVRRVLRPGGRLIIGEIAVGDPHFSRLNSLLPRAQSAGLAPRRPFWLPTRLLRPLHQTRLTTAAPGHPAQHAPGHIQKSRAAAFHARGRSGPLKSAASGECFGTIWADPRPSSRSTAATAKQVSGVRARRPARRHGQGRTAFDRLFAGRWVVRRGRSRSAPGLVRVIVSLELRAKGAHCQRRHPGFVLGSITMINRGSGPRRPRAPYRPRAPCEHAGSFTSCRPCA